MEKILVTKTSLPPMEEYIEEIKELWDSHWITNMGTKHNEFQDKLVEYMHVNNVELMVNGHMALEMAIQAFDLKGEVITSPFTFASTTHAIVRNGLTPVFCDIKEDDFTIDPAKIEALITDKTCAIVPIHVYGNICDVEAIEQIAKKHNLVVIYDAAHTFGESYNGTGVGNFGDASIFSFHATKVFNSIEGGCVCFKNNRLREILYNLKNFGIKNQECVEAVGANAKMNEFQAAMGVCNLRHIDQYIEDRKRVVKKYQSLLTNVPGITIWKEQNNVKHNYAYFPILVDEKAYGESRDTLFKRLDDAGIGARKYFYPITSAFDAYKGKYDPGDTPIAHKMSETVLTLPLYPELDDMTIEKICFVIKMSNNRRC
ncbi:MAG: DegT/DnrJ/EryC1/StrS family aminotransferase [Lachnospiraceae bacterium]|nr:DegT/DnrJ/EryC1/StrS family aminotransferase [Lachnospiraceae bacterium]